MARLSINDLNDLSGASDEVLNNVYKSFRSAHTRVFNNIQHWISSFDSSIKELDKLCGTGYKNDLKVYNYARKMYYEGIQILDDADLFNDFTSEYSSVLYKLRKSDSEIRALSALISSKKKEMINMISECYGLYTEAYDRIYGLEETYEG